MKVFSLSPFLAAVAAMTAMMPAMRVRTREPRQNRGPVCTGIFHNFAPTMSPANTAPFRGWWNEPQSDESAAAAKKAAEARRVRKAMRPDASNYAIMNCPV